MKLPEPITREIVLVGGGHTHALVLRMWGMAPLPGVRLTLIDPAPAAAYSGMLPGHIAGHYPRAALEIDLVKLARFAGARLVLGRATGIDRAKRRVQVEGHADIAYDHLSIDVGVTSDMPGLPGFRDLAVPAKPLALFADRWEAFVSGVTSGAVAPEVAVIGAGLAGVELALAVRHRLGLSARVALIEAAEPLAAVGRGARAALMAHLQRSGVVLHAGRAAIACTADGVVLEGSETVPASFIIGTAAARAGGWLQGTGLALEGGFVRVGPTLQSNSDPHIFAVGDIAHLTHAPRPKAGVFAVREAPVLLANLRALATGDRAQVHYQPQSDYLKLVSTGHKGAVADKWGLRLDGGLLWRWKDRIDRKFMAKFHDLPTMAAQGPAGTPSDRPLCGGCGAKAGRGALDRALARLPAPQRADVATGAGDDAAVLIIGGEHQVITTDHLRAFTFDPYVMARIAAVHALGDVWSMGATPQAVLAQIILPPMGEGLQAEWLREIMEGALTIFAPEGADIVGGHTTLGAELTIGFTVTGLAPRSVTHAGARPGQAILLTKPIGTGVIMAAEMLGAAPGRVVAGALTHMQRPQGRAARLLAPHATAMTDVTGFGLAGHLLSILDASGVAATLRLSDIPTLPGAVELAGAGHGSSLLPANLAVRARMFYSDGPKAELLFDPQTAGGLLATVPADVAEGLVAALRAAGEEAAIIGHVAEGVPFLTVDD
ncbi:selenide, water dikinase SelD [Frigidibacter sp. RF13]|uniref:selenide, water dikinase SelD n=1 Tax=Frigidibacter sp. RF13 TaxID=2997340 RepID=UPI00227043F4|nr:selenide, water dikinase SelD [Frigidibacter sp. RF13]MCY1126484.1 selenide, water dikinase SelD [Frigidibacter sp. RF13]